MRHWAILLKQNKLTSTFWLRAYHFLPTNINCFKLSFLNPQRKLATRIVLTFTFQSLNSEPCSRNQA